MAVRIRLRRTGKRNAPAHRIVVTDKRNPRDGKFIECIGTYNPRHSTENIDIERVDYWLSQGAQPSETVSAIIKRCRANVSLSEQKKTVEGKDFVHPSQQQKPKVKEVDAESAEEASGESEAVEAGEAQAEPETSEDAAATEAGEDDVAETNEKTEEQE
mgnify:CR=1 FL=1